MYRPCTGLCRGCAAVTRSPEADALVLLKIDGNVASVTLSRPHRHNSLVPELLQQLTAAFQTIAEQLDRERKAFIKHVTTPEAIAGVENFIAGYREDT